LSQVKTSMPSISGRLTGASLMSATLAGSGEEIRLKPGDTA